MKTYSIGCLMLMAACVCGSCAHTEIPEGNAPSSQNESEKCREICFSPFFLEVTGGIADWKPAGRTASRGETLSSLATTLSYWDCVDNKLIQSNTQETSSPLEMKLLYGLHHVFFLAHSSKSESSSEKVFTPEKVTETFWTDFPLEVNSRTESNQTIPLDRVVSKAKITVLDAVPEEVSGMRMTVGSHYRTLDLKTGNAVTQPLPYFLSWELGNKYIGRAGLEFTIYTFTPTAKEEHNTSLKIEALSKSGEVLFSREANSIPLLRNRCTNVKCRLFSTNASISFSDPGAWEPELELEI